MSVSNNLFNFIRSGCLIVLVCTPSIVDCIVRPPLIYSNDFAVHITEGDAIADKIANKHGFLNRGQIGSLKNYYLFEHKRINKRSIESNSFYHESLSAEPEVHWVQQQHEKKRRKRDFNLGPSVTPFSQYFEPIVSDLPSHGHPRYRSILSTNFPDPLFKEQWYLNGGAKDGLDMNLEPAWNKGYTGRGVVVSILDDGIQTNHPDLAQNYDPLASTDINGNDDDPMPQDNGDNKHGTRCAGEVAAVAFNQYCGIGVAYNSSIGGVRMLDGIVNDAVEARALGLNPEHIDIYSASWGPEDDGKTVDGPGPLARRAFIYGVTSGRKGKGSIFVWASGNGGRHTDSCNCDGYTNSIFTLSISSATQGGYKPWYLEECSSTLATTYSSGTPGHDKSVATVDMDARLRHDHICTVEHTGTSASAPLAAGICALALEANPGLTWRDLQYLVVLTSRSSPLEKENGWIVNGVGRKVSHKFGYGLIDAGALVTKAEEWISVPPQHICKSQELIEERQIDAAYGTTLSFHMDVDACRPSLNEVRYLEHVQCKISLRFFPRGNLRILLTSPSGTTSTLLFERPRDVISSNFDDWPFLSVHFWGEEPKGRWILQVINAGNRHVNQPGVLRKWQLVFYGTAVDPARKRPPRPLGQWKSPLNAFTFPTVADAPATPITDNGFFGGAPDQFKSFHNYGGVFALAGSEPEAAVRKLGQPKVRAMGAARCDAQCDGCDGEGPARCVRCRRFRMEGTCVGACPPRSFADAGGECRACHEACETCTGYDQKSCRVCSNGWYMVVDLDICLQQCPDGYYQADNRCLACQPNCISCQGRPDFCTSCDHHLLLFQNKCLAACPTGTYETDDYSCVDCDSTCKTCNGTKSTDCIKCPTKHFWHNGTCLDSCPTHFYADSKANECFKCPENCVECTKIGCLTCTNTNFTIQNGICINPKSIDCKPGEYFDQNCKKCDLNCKTCNGGQSDACLSCKNGLYLQDNRCVGACKHGWYFNREDKRCEACLHTCTKCTSLENCTECKIGLQLQGGECSLVCPDGFYSDMGKCERCFMSCKTCSGPGSAQCVNCPSSWQLLAGECRPNCPIGYHKSAFGCQKCRADCVDCIGCETEGANDDETQKIEALVQVRPIEVIASLNWITGVTIFGVFCLVVGFVVVFVILQKSTMRPRGDYRLSVEKSKVRCNYNIVAVSDEDDTDDEERDLIIGAKPEPTAC